jgi:hypothetical protein
MKVLIKILERSMWFYPLFHITSIIVMIMFFFKTPNLINFLCLVFLIYFLSPLLYRIISLIIPIHMGKIKLGPKQPPSGWMIAHRLQMTYHIFPFLEGILNSLPGLYTNWLRLWGSKIGRMVYWAPDVRLYDRTHLTIGDHCFIGGSLLSCHIGTPTLEGDTVLFFAPITIGNRVFISTQCNLGPGSNIKDGEYIKILTQILGDQRKELV